MYVDIVIPNIFNLNKNKIYNSFSTEIFVSPCVYKQIICIHIYLVIWSQPFRGPYRQKIIFIIIRFYAITHRTTIVQNKIISIICSCLLLSPANIYRPSLGKVQLGRNCPNLYQSLNICLRRKIEKTFYSELYGLQCIVVRFLIFIFIYFKKII